MSKAARHLSDADMHRTITGFSNPTVKFLRSLREKKHRKQEKRFLAEGLAVYLHTKLAGNPAFPNFGRDLRQLAERGLSGVESLAPLNSGRTPRPLGTVMEEKTAYILAGSFVGFLIEREGLALFRSLYETGNYEKVYGKPLRMLEETWRVSLREP